MNEVIFTSAMLTLVMAAIAICVVWMMLRFLDYLSGFKFKEFFNAQNTQQDLGTFFYLGARFIGVCLLVGYLFS